MSENDNKPSLLHWRKPSASEILFMKTLLSPLHIQCREIFFKQLMSCEIREPDPFGWLEFRLLGYGQNTENKKPYRKLPCEGWYKDDDGRHVLLLIWIDELDRLQFLEYVKYGGPPIIEKTPSPDRLTVTLDMDGA